MKKVIDDIPKLNFTFFSEHAPVEKVFKVFAKS
jgi:hypothetical protein